MRSSDAFSRPVTLLLFLQQELLVIRTDNDDVIFDTRLVSKEKVFGIIRRFKNIRLKEESNVIRILLPGDSIYNEVGILMNELQQEWLKAGRVSPYNDAGNTSTSYYPTFF